MARIAGVDLPRGKRIEIALTYIFGIGRPRALQILVGTGVNPDTRTQDLTDEDVSRLRREIESKYKVEGALRTETSMNVKRLMDIGCYRGLRHRRGLPVRGQRPTPTRAPTRAPGARSRGRRRRPRSSSAGRGAPRRSRGSSAREHRMRRREGLPRDLPADRIRVVEPLGTEDEPAWRRQPPAVARLPRPRVRRRASGSWRPMVWRTSRRPSTTR